MEWMIDVVGLRVSEWSLVDEVRESWRSKLEGPVHGSGFVRLAIEYLKPLVSNELLHLSAWNPRNETMLSVLGLVKVFGLHLLGPAGPVVFISFVPMASDWC